MKKSKSLYHGHRFPAGVISCAVRWYFRFQLSLRDIEELLFVRDVVVTYAPKEVPLGDETIRCWCDRFGTGSARRVKTARRKPGSTWHLDEMFVIRRGELYLLWRAVDEYGAERFFQASAALEPRATQNHHRSVAQLSGSKGRNPRAGERKARVRQSGGPAEQSG